MADGQRPPVHDYVRPCEEGVAVGDALVSQRVCDCCGKRFLIEQALPGSTCVPCILHDHLPKMPAEVQDALRIVVAALQEYQRAHGPSGSNEWVRAAFLSANDACWRFGPTIITWLAGLYPAALAAEAREG